MSCEGSRAQETHQSGAKTSDGHEIWAVDRICSAHGGHGAQHCLRTYKAGYMQVGSCILDT
jgi:hypothetical protein